METVTDFIFLGSKITADGDCSHEIWRKQWHPTPVLLPGKSHGWRSLVGCSPRGREESDTTEQLPFHFSLSCIGEGNGNALQCSCLENPRDRRAWWASVYGVAQSRTRLKRLSSSSSSSNSMWNVFIILVAEQKVQIIVEVSVCFCCKAKYSETSV